MPPATHRAVAIPPGYSSTVVPSGRTELVGYLPILIHYELDLSHERAKLPATSVYQVDDLPRLEDHLHQGHLPRGNFRRLLRYPGDLHSAYAR